MRNHIHFHKTQLFMQAFLFDRYKTIQKENKPIFEAGLLVQEKVTTLSQLIGENPLTDVIRSLYEIIRIEPENPYTLHRRIPSARNMFSNIIVLYIPLGVGSDVFQYDCICDDFIFVKHEPKVTVKEPVWVIKYNHQNIGRLYGRFGFVLSLLDAGHMIHHIQEVMANPSTVEYFPNDLRKQDEDIIASIGFNQLFLELKWDEGLEKISQRDQKGDPIIDDLYHGFSQEISQDLISLRRNMKPKMNDSYLSACHIRTSFQSYQGLMFSDTDKVCQVVGLEPHREFIEGLSLVVIDCKNKKIYGGKAASYDDLMIEKLLHDSHEYVNMKEVRLLIFAVLKKGEYTPKQIATSFVQSAEWMNEISSYYANNDFITRCLRNIDDYYVKENLVDCEYVTYLLMVGDNEIDELLKGVV